MSGVASVSAPTGAKFRRRRIPFVSPQPLFAWSGPPGDEAVVGVAVRGDNSRSPILGLGIAMLDPALGKNVVVTPEGTVIG
jgi:hypothetical protein